MINFDFYSPTKIYFGKDRELEVGNIIKGYGFKKILLHYGKSSIKKTGLYDKVVTSLNNAGIEFVELGGVEPNPKLSLVKVGVEICKSSDIDMILAVGGGSVIDSAKSIACGTFIDVDPWLISNHTIKPEKALPVGVILTISAAGSELSNSCVISHDELLIKNGFNSDLIRPLFSIMNPELTYTVSKFQTGCGIVDIMMHTLERNLVDVGRNEFALNMSEGLLKAVMDAGSIAINNPNDYEARAILMIASSFSHNGLTGMGSVMYFTVHKLEHQISGLFDEVAHGAGLSVLFPAWAKYVYKDFIPYFSRLAYNVMGIDKNIKEIDAALAGILKIEAYFKSLDMPTTLHDLGIDFSKIEEMADRITNNDTITVPGIKELNKQDVIEIFNIAKGE